MNPPATITTKANSFSRLSTHRRKKNPPTTRGIEIQSKIQLSIYQPALFFPIKNLTSAHVISAAAMPIPTNNNSSARKKAHIISTVKGNRNWVSAKRTILLPDLPPVRAPVNFDSKKNWITPEAAPIKIAIRIIKHSHPLFVKKPPQRR